MQLLNTLYLTTPETYLRLDNDTLRVELERETRLRVPLHHLSAVVCFGHINLSAPLMHRLADSGIALVLLDDNGRFKARWVATSCCGRRSSSVLPTRCSRWIWPALVLQAKSRTPGRWPSAVRASPSPKTKPAP